MSSAAAHSRLTIDLSAVAENYRRMVAAADGVAVGVVLKGDAYGLGLTRVAQVLAREGAACFFVAYAVEGLELRRCLAALGVSAKIYVLAGLHDRLFESYVENDLIPVLNSPGHVAGWAREGGRRGVKLPGAVQVDLGLNRLGLTCDELEALAAGSGLLAQLTPDLLIGHLPFANDGDSPANPSHLARFREVRKRLPAWRGSLASSAAVFLGPDYRQDLVRAGSALFGVNPTRGRPNPMLPVVSLESRIIQVRDLGIGQTIGYDGSFRARRRTVLGIVSVGASDGIDRKISLGGRATVLIAGHSAEIIGAGGTDMLFVDLTGIPRALCVAGQAVELLGRSLDLETMARQSGITEYEILAGLGRRPERSYLG